MLFYEESRTERVRGEWKAGKDVERNSGEGQREFEPEQTQIGSAAHVCVRVFTYVTFWMCVKHNEGVNTLISDFQNELPFIQAF